jgi:hypothetical protein
MRQHAPVREVVKVNGVYIPYEEWRRQHPLTPEQIEANRRGFMEWLAGRKKS